MAHFTDAGDCYLYYLPLRTPGTICSRQRFYDSDAANSLRETHTHSAQTSPTGPSLGAATSAGASPPARPKQPWAPPPPGGGWNVLVRTRSARRTCSVLAAPGNQASHGTRRVQAAQRYRTAWRKVPGQPPWVRGRKASPDRGTVRKTPRPLHSPAEPRSHVPTSVCNDSNYGSKYVYSS